MMSANKEVIARFRKAFGLDQGYSLLLLENAKDTEEFLLSLKKHQLPSIYELYLAAREERLITRVPQYLSHVSKRKESEVLRSTISGDTAHNKEKRIKETDNKIRLFAPTEGSSFSYRVYYFKVAFSVWLNILEGENLSKEAEETVSFYAKYWLTESRLGINEQLYLTIKSIVLNNLLAQRLLSNELPFDEYVDHSLCLLMNEDVNRDTLELLKFLAQFFFYEELEENANTLGEKVLDATIDRLAYKLSNIIYKHGFSVKAGVLLAKLGISVRRCNERQDAFNILGLLASNLYGAKQLSYDAYYSWLHMKAVGEIEQLLGPGFFNSIEETEARWRRSSEGTSAVALMYNNYAYVCSDMGDSYNISEKLHKTFYSIAVTAAERAISTAETLIKKPNRNDSRQDYLVRLLNTPLMTEIASFYCTLGSILRDNVFIEDQSMNSRAISAYKKLNEYYSEAKEIGYRVSYEYWLNGCCGLVESLLSSIIHDQSSTDSFPSRPNENNPKWRDLFEAIDRYYTLDVPASDRDSQPDLQERENLRPVLQFLTEAQKSIPSCPYRALQEIAQSLLIIWRCAKEIEENLIDRSISPVNYLTREEGINDIRLSHERETKPVAYYTTIQTASFIFDNLIQEAAGKAPKVDNSIKDGKNCLTVVHAKNMNDPYEGLTLLKSFQEVMEDENNIVLPKGSEIDFREKLYRGMYVFLKSFTDNIDALVMWNRYASDYDSDGHNSNGCCIEFAPECFHRLTDSAEKTLINSDDISQLYQVIYLSDSYSIEDIHNRNISELNAIKRLYAIMRDELRHVNESVIAINNSPDISTSETKDILISLIRSALSASLSKTLFLFKSDAYSEEHESRLIYTRNQNQTDSIRILDGIPKKLAINPFFQVYIKRIIFGPNVRDPDGWKPFFQFQLYRMWERSERSNNGRNSSISDSFSIENSRIHYRT